MNNMKKHTFMDRIRGAGRALRGKPVGSISLGVEVKPCKDCEYLKRCKEMDEKEEGNA